jgi:Glycosyl transferase family 2
VKLVSHINADGDLLEAWLEHHRALGVDAFHLIVHGPREENQRLYELAPRYPITIEEEYGGVFHSTEKVERLNRLVTRLSGQWLLVVDSDEFLELPYGDLAETVRVLERLRVDVLQSHFLQRLSNDGSLDSPEIVADPFAAFPLCSLELYRRMGVDAAVTKHPLFYSTGSTRLHDAGTHGAPLGSRCWMAPLQGVSHHFKWRRTASERLRARAGSIHPWRHESQGFAAYLADHAQRLPIEGAFRYSREELFRRGLLGVWSRKRYAARWVLGALPEFLDEGCVEVFRRFASSSAPMM